MKLLKKISEIFKIVMMWSFAALAVLLMIFQAYYLSKLYKKTDIFDLDNIIVKNNTILTPGDVIELSKIKRGVRVMDIDKNAVRKRLNSAPEIKSSRLKIVYPSTLVIYVEESMPLAYINQNGVLKYVAENGKILKSAKPGTGYDLPIICSDIEKDIIDFLNLSLQISPFIYHQISEIEMTGQGIELYLVQHSANVIAGKKEMEKKIIVLENFLKDEYGNLAFDEVEYIDLRFDKQVILKEYPIAGK
ncbi:MAG: FtsQ-type POTRA domain-containing protein [Candidatus Delongbacteria bacterium]